MSQLTDREARLLAEVSSDALWQHAGTIAQWQRISGTPEERIAVDYLRQRLEEYGLKTSLYQFEALLGWPEDAHLEIRSPEIRSMEATTHSFVPSTAPEGLEAEVVYLGTGEEEDFYNHPVAGKIVMLEGMASPTKVLRGQRLGAIGEIFVAANHVHDMCVSPVWGTPTPRTAGMLPKLPVISISHPLGEELKTLLHRGPLRVRMHTRTFWGWRTVPLLVGEVAGVFEPEDFLLLSGHHCSWYYGAMDNGTANATMLEIARLLAAHRKQLRRSVRIAFWPGHTQGRYAGSTWYFDHFWEELHDHCVLHVNVDSTGGRGATIYESLAMPETRDYGLQVLRDGLGLEGHPGRQSRSGDQSFWGCGVPSLWMDLSQVPLELAADLGNSGLFTAAAQDSLHQTGGLAWWWHTPEDTLDKIDPEVLVKDTSAYLLACWRVATEPILPFRYLPAAMEIRETLERYQAGAGDRFDLGLTLERARELEIVAAELDGLLDRLRLRPEAEELAAEVNRGVRAMDRFLVMVNFTAKGPFDQDLALPIPPVPLLEPARQLGSMDPSASETRYLVTELTRHRNQVAFQLREALAAGRRTESFLRQALDQ